jgi:hypothetical protein
LIFQKANDQGIAFRYSCLTINCHTNQFSWRHEGWGTLFLSTQEATRCIPLQSEQQFSLEGECTAGDRFFVIGCTSSTFLEFASTPLVPLNVMLADAIHSSSQLSPEKQTNGILQKLRLRGDCVVDDHPVCLVAINATRSL